MAGLHDMISINAPRTDAGGILTFAYVLVEYQSTDCLVRKQAKEADNLEMPKVRRNGERIYPMGFGQVR